MNQPDVKAIVGGVLGRYAIHRRESEPGARLAEDLGIDSLTLVIVVTDVEAALGILIPADAFTEENMLTVGDLMRLASELVGKGA